MQVRISDGSNCPSRWYQVAAGVFGAALLFAAPVVAQPNEQSLEASGPAEPRFALVIGQSDYQGSRLYTGTSDAARLSEALRAAGFSVDGGADLEQHLIREKVRDLAGRVRSAGKDAVIVVYVVGRVAQIDGENIILPVGASLQHASDVIVNGYRFNDLINALKHEPAMARIIILDAGTPPAHLAADRKFSPGLAAVEAPDGFLIAFSQNPGRPLLEPEPPMGVFGKALLDALQQPVGSMSDFFAFARRRVFEESESRQLPWNDSKIANVRFSFYPPKDGVAMLPTIVQAEGEKVDLGSMSREAAFERVIASDKIADYQDFIVRFPNDEALPSVQYTLAVRREAEVWARALRLNTADAYWTYNSMYPDGGNVEVARYRLALLGAHPSPGPAFAPIQFADLPRPLPKGEEIASSASMNLEEFKRAPRFNLPPIAPLAAAAAIAPVGIAVARQLPTVQMPAFRPQWAAAPAQPLRNIQRGGGPSFQSMPGRQPTVATPAPTPRGTAAGPSTYQPVTRPSSSIPPTTQPIRATSAPPVQGGGYRPVTSPTGVTGAAGTSTTAPRAPAGQFHPVSRAGSPGGDVATRPLQPNQPARSNSPGARAPQTGSNQPPVSGPGSPRSAQGSFSGQARQNASQARMPRMSTSRRVTAPKASTRSSSTRSRR